MTNPPRVAFIGGGNMVRSLVGGLLARGHPRHLLGVSEPLRTVRDTLARDFGIDVVSDNAAVLEGADLVVLAVKPQHMKEVCAGIAAHRAVPPVTFISVAAGVRLAQLERWLGAGARLVRAMPNTPALIGAGITGLIANDKVGADGRALAAEVLGAAGRTIWIEREQLMDAVTAVSGSGPAYFFLLLEALEAAGIAQGLPAEAARELASHTALGAARMACAGDVAPAQLRERVTSPGGTTQAALEVLEAGGFRRLVADAVASATRRGAELSERLGD